MLILLQVAAVVLAVVALTRWLRHRRHLLRVERHFVEAVLTGDFRRADVEAGRWFSAARGTGRLTGQAPPWTSPARRVDPPGEASPGSGLTAA